MKVNNIMKRIIEFAKQPLIYIVLICVILQFFMYSTVSESIMTPDSHTYAELYQRNIFKGEVDSSRTPVYPYFIKIVKMIGGEENLANNVALAQKILFIGTLILFYYCVCCLTKNKIIIVIITLVFGISPYIVLWNVLILTEALSLFEITLLTLLTLNYLKKPNSIIAGGIRYCYISNDYDKTFIYIFTSYIYIVLDFTLFISKRRKKKSWNRNNVLLNLCRYFIRILYFNENSTWRVFDNSYFIFK